MRLRDQPSLPSYAVEWGHFELIFGFSWGDELSFAFGFFRTSSTTKFCASAPFSFPLWEGALLLRAEASLLPLPVMASACLIASRSNMGPSSFGSVGRDL